VAVCIFALQLNANENANAKCKWKCNRDNLEINGRKREKRKGKKGFVI